MQSCDVWLYGSSNVTKIGLDLSVKLIELGVGNWNSSTHAKARQSSLRTGKTWPKPVDLGKSVNLVHLRLDRSF